MIPLLLLALAGPAQNPPAPPPPKSEAELRFQGCAALAKRDPAKAAEQADAWRVTGGGVLASECLGVAYVGQERWGPAEVAFEQAANDAEIQHDGRAGTLWVQAGNAALAGDDPSKARQAFDRALALPVLSDPMRGETYLDRGRAAVALNDMASARADIDQALKLVGADPLAWLLSATLARRQADATRATADIAEALKRAPDDPDVLFESGKIAELRGDHAAARDAWMRAADKDPQGPGAAALAATTQGSPLPKP